MESRGVASAWFAAAAGSRSAALRTPCSPRTFERRPALDPPGRAETTRARARTPRRSGRRRGRAAACMSAAASRSAGSAASDAAAPQQLAHAALLPGAGRGTGNAVHHGQRDVRGDAQPHEEIRRVAVEQRAEHQLLVDVEARAQAEERVRRDATVWHDRRDERRPVRRAGDVTEGEPLPARTCSRRSSSRAAVPGGDAQRGRRGVDRERVTCFPSMIGSPRPPDLKCLPVVAGVQLAPEAHVPAGRRSRAAGGRALPSPGWQDRAARAGPGWRARAPTAARAVRA